MRIKDKIYDSLKFLFFFVFPVISITQAYAKQKYQPETDPKPIVLLMVDTSSSMLLTADKHNRQDTSNLSFSDDNEDYMDANAPDYMPECNRTFEGPFFNPSRHYEYSRFMEVIQYIIGDIKALHPWDTPLDPTHPSYLRYMCEHIGLPGKQGYSEPLIVKNTHNPIGHKINASDLIPDGLIELMGTKARVGLMFTDNDPSSKFSFGPDDSNGNNYGVMAVDAPNKPTILPPDTDDDDTIASNSASIINNLLKWLKPNPNSVPQGGSPIGSMLADAYYYFNTHQQIQKCTAAGQTNCDRYHDCRAKYVVLFTDGFMNIDDNGVLQGNNGWPKKLHDIGVMVIVVTPDGSTHQLYETDTKDAYTNVMGQIAFHGGSHWVQANGWGQGYRFIFGMPEFDPGVNTFYPNDTDGQNDYDGRESMLRNLGRPWLANLLTSGSMVNHWVSKTCSKRRYISDLAFTDETMPTTDLAGDPNYTDHYAGVIAGGFYQHGFKLAWQDQVNSNVAGNLGNSRITMFGAPYDDGGMHLTFYSCKNPLGTDHSEPGPAFSVDTDSRNWRYANTDVTANQMKLYSVVYNNNSGFLRELINGTPQPPDPSDLGINTLPWSNMNMAFRPGDEDTDILNWHNEFGSFISGLAQSWSSKLLNVHTGGTELRWSLEMSSDPNSPMRVRRMNTLISFLAGRPLHCENNSENTNMDSDCGGGFGYVNTGWYAYGPGSDRLELYNYHGNPTGAGFNKNMLARFGPTGHFAPAFIGHLQHSSSQSPGFIYFKDHIVNKRPTTLYVQTRDGILHEMAINALQGETPAQNNHRELWRFIPGSLLNKVRMFQMLGQNLSDGPITVAPVLLSKTYSQLNETAEQEAQRWRIVLVAGIGYNDVSGKTTDPNHFNNGIYALDVTDPLNPHLLWEITNKKRCQGSSSGTSVTCYTSGEENNYSHLGYTVSKPAIGTVHIGDQSSGKDVAVAIFGGGMYPVPSSFYRFPQGKSIFIVNLETGEKIAEMNYSHNAIDYCNGVGISDPVISGISCFPTGPDKIIRQCVAVTSNGRLWLINLSGNEPSNWEAYMAFDPYQGAAGGNLSLDDTQRVETFKAPILTRSYGGELYAYYASETSITNGIDDFSHKNFVAAVKVQIPQSCPGDLPKLWLHVFDSQEGERVQGRMALFGGDLYMTSYTPAPFDGCKPGTGKIIAVDAMNAGDSGDWKKVSALTDDHGNDVSEIDIPHVIPNGLLLATLPTCVQDIHGDYYSTNLPGGDFQGFGSDLATISNPQVIVPLGSAGEENQLGGPGSRKKAQTENLPAKVIKGGGGGGMKTRVIPTSWSLIFD